MEIERKFLVSSLPNLADYPFRLLEQAYLCTEPVVRVRREDDSFYLTYKGKGLMVREEYNLPLTREAYEHLLTKADGIVIRKKRYLIPYAAYTIELDIFDAPYEELIIAEVEFPTEDEALTFCPPEWFGEDVTCDKRYHNSNLSRGR
ncbi:MAG: CYTH domain-containing protein [Lachnospiraceae bacterium]|nr:CYTH domain-containing protein [Lachnospiraceae bacterium]